MEQSLPSEYLARTVVVHLRYLQIFVVAKYLIGINVYQRASLPQVQDYNL